jgi:hypothetical protein
MKAIKLGILLAVVGIAVFLSRGSAKKEVPLISVATPTPAPTSTPEAAQASITSLVLEVPFTSQAPLGDWQDPRQQNGCEEAVGLMAVYWAQGRSLTKEEARQKIIDISDNEQETYGEHRDTSAQDTLDRIIKGYFQYDKAFVQSVSSFEDIYRQLERGRVVIVPMNGQKLGNPNYVAPGPAEHMIVVKGYDSQTDEFITNDPGTRKGEGYRYRVPVFLAAIRDYPTGYRLPIKEINKVMIVVEKQ